MLFPLPALLLLLSLSGYPAAPLPPPPQLQPWSGDLFSTPLAPGVIVSSSLSSSGASVASSSAPAADAPRYALLHRIRSLGPPSLSDHADAAGAGDALLALIARESTSLVQRFGGADHHLEGAGEGADGEGGDVSSPWAMCDGASPLALRRCEPDAVLPDGGGAAASGGGRYSRDAPLGRGANGEVWRAKRLNAAGDVDADAPAFVIKRIFSRRPAALLSGYREIYFGLLPDVATARPNVAVFTEYWHRDAPVSPPPTSPSSSSSSSVLPLVEDVAPPPASLSLASNGSAAAQVHAFAKRTLLLGAGGDSDEEPEAEGESELFLVFEDHGLSLQQLIFAVAPARPVPAEEQGGDRDNSFPVGGDGPSSGDSNADAGAPPPPGGSGLSPSVFWRRMRTEPNGHAYMRRILYGVALALSSLHAHGITHRDVKSSNLLLGTDGAGAMEVRLCDFGSAVNANAERRFYAEGGPSVGEETLAYAPPEARLEGRPYERALPCSYDVFTLGVTWLELLLGRPPSSIFEPSQRIVTALKRRAHRVAAAAAAAARTAAGRDHDSDDSGGGNGGGDGSESASDDESASDTALLAAGLHSLCIAPPGTPVLIDPDAGEEEEGGDEAGRRNRASPTAAVKEVVCDGHLFRSMLRRLDVAAQARALLKTPSVIDEGDADGYDSQNNFEGGRERSALVMRENWGGGAAIKGDIRDEQSSSAVATIPRLLPAPEFPSTALVNRFFDDWALTLPRWPQVVGSGSPSQPLLPSPSGASTLALPEPPSHDLALQPPRIATAAAVGSSDAPVDSYSGPFDPEDEVERTLLNADSLASSTPPSRRVVALLGCAGEDLLYRMLQWRAGDRISAKDALAHPYFTGFRSREEEEEMCGG